MNASKWLAALMALAAFSVVGAQESSGSAWIANGVATYQDTTTTYAFLTLAEQDPQTDDYVRSANGPIDGYAHLASPLTGTQVAWSNGADGFDSMAKAHGEYLDFSIRSPTNRPIVQLYFGRLTVAVDAHGACPKPAIDYTFAMSQTKLFVDGNEIDLPADPQPNQRIQFNGPTFDGYVVLNARSEDGTGVAITGAHLVMSFEDGADTANVDLSLGYARTKLDCLVTPVELQSFEVE